MPKRKRNRVKKLTIREISGVDFPAQEPALASAIKSAETKNLVDIATSADEGHQHGIEVNAYDGDLYVYVSYATAEGSENSHTHAILRNDDGTFSVLESDGHTHEIDSVALSNAIMEVFGVKFADPKASESNDGETEEAQMSKTVQKATEQEKAVDACREADLSPAHKAFHDALPEKDRGDFLRSDYEGRESRVAKAAEAEEARKAADPQTQEIEALKARVAVFEEAEAVSKAAEIGMPVPAYKAIASLPEGDRDEALKAFEAAKAAVDYVGNHAGVSGGKGFPGSSDKSYTKAEAEAEAESIAREDVAKNGGDYHAALVNAYKSNPALARAVHPQNGA